MTVVEFPASRAPDAREEGKMVGVGLPPQLVRSQGVGFPLANLAFAAAVAVAVAKMAAAAKRIGVTLGGRRWMFVRWQRLITSLVSEELSRYRYRRYRHRRRCLDRCRWK